MSDVCPQCARRVWLLEKLATRLDFRARNLARLWPILELPDADLIQALGGRRREELHAAYAEWEPSAPQTDGLVRSVCRHHLSYPKRLGANALAPHTLSVRGGIERLGKVLDEKVVAIVGTRRASDYGLETAHNLARGLAASGLTVASGLAEGIPAAVHSGALEAGKPTLTVMAEGVERCSPAWCRELYDRILSNGCAVSERRATPSGRARGWWQAGRERTLALLAELVIVVEAGEHPWEMACARVAQAHGRAVAAVPGRVSSPASRGTNALLMEGTRLIRSPQDALDILYGVGIRQQPVSPWDASVDLEPRLRAVLERVGDGDDTIAKLTARGSKSGDVSLALTELELQGLLSRGDGGRYVPSAGALAA
jgi:DNA processing protein